MSGKNFESSSSLIDKVSIILENIWKAIKSIITSDNTVDRKQLSPPTIYPLNLNGTIGQQNWLKHKNNLNNFNELEKFVKKYPSFDWFADRLDKVKSVVHELNEPEDFDASATSDIANSTVKVAKQFMGAIQSCDSMIKNSSNDSKAANELKNLIENYLSGFGIQKMNFKPGDSYEDWANLSMNAPVGTVKTNDQSKYNKLKEINIQPHYFAYVTGSGKVKQIYFGGSCTVYKFEA